jgi:hypothetical protein
MRIGQLIERVREPRRWTYWVAAVPFALTAMYGWEAGAGPMYFGLAAVCAVQFFYPTRLAWGVVFAAYSFASVYYLYLLVVDLVPSGFGSSRSILIDSSDTIAYLIWIAFLLGTVWLLWRMRSSRTIAATDKSLRPSNRQ